MRPFTRYKSLREKRGNFTIIPNELLGPSLGSLALENRHRLLLLTLLSRCFTGETFKASQRLLKDLSGLGNDTLVQTTADLEKAGFIRVSRVGNCANEYNLNGFFEYMADLFEKTPALSEKAAPPVTPPEGRSVGIPAHVQAELAAAGVDIQKETPPR